MCTNDLIVLPPLGIFSFSFYFFSEKNPVCRDRTHVPTCQKLTWLPLSYRGDRHRTAMIAMFLNTTYDDIAPCTLFTRVQTISRGKKTVPQNSTYSSTNILYFDMCVCVCVCFLPIHSGHQWTYQPESHRREVTQKLLIHLSAVRAFIFLARRIQPFLSLVDREVEFCTNDLIVLHPLGIFSLVF